MSNYSNYATKICKEFKEIQKEFVEDYELDSYEEWYYDEETTLLTFKNLEKSTELNFKYIPIGSYSRSSKTWSWAWDNRDNLHENKLQTLVVRKFGETENYSELTNGYFEADEFIGWELTAITYDLIDAIGAYRIVNDDNLEIYFLIIEEIDNDFVEDFKTENKTKTAKRIDCEKHGKSRGAFICQHLNKIDKVGFEESFETEIGMDLYVDDDISAWCSKCEEVRLRDNGWNDENMEIANIKIVCEACYFEIKEINKK